MKFGKTVAVGAVSALAFGAGLMPASADVVKITAENVQQGQPFKVTVTCQQGDRAFGVLVNGARRAAGRLGANHVGQASVPLAINEVGKVKLTAVCSSYNGTDKSKDVSIAVKPIHLLITPHTWRAGQKINLTGYGLTAGENVNIQLVRKANGKTYWNTGGGTVGADGTYKHSLVLKSDVPQGSYYLYATGSKSGVKLRAEFSWGRPDSNDPAKKKSQPGSIASEAPKDDAAPAESGSQTVGLPKTGA